jgi:hypothetical protein
MSSSETGRLVDGIFDSNSVIGSDATAMFDKRMSMRNGLLAMPLTTNLRGQRACLSNRSTR